MVKPSITTKAQSPHSNKPCRLCLSWAVILLIPIIFYLPLWAEMLQIKLIGYEGFCCMPDNWQELRQASIRAQSMRLDSNLILGAGVVLAILLLIGTLFILYRYSIPCLSIKWLKRLFQVMVGILVAPLALLLFLTLIMLVFHNDDFHKIRYHPPRDSIYSYALDLIGSP